MWKKIISGLFVLGIVSLLGFFTYATIKGTKKNEQKTINPKKASKKKKAKQNKPKNFPEVNRVTSPPPTNPPPPQHIVLKKTEEESALPQTNDFDETKVTAKEEVVVEKELPKSVTPPLLSAELLEKALADMQIKNWKDAIQLKYGPNQGSKIIDPQNNYQIVDFVLIPDLFQKMVIKEVAKRINFADLIISFVYHKDLKKVKVKIVFKEEITINQTLYFQVQATT